MTFGQWIKQRRKALDITQAELASMVGCAVITLYKIEVGERRPSKHMADLLAEHLKIPAAERAAFVRFARSEAPDAAFGTALRPPTNLTASPTPLIGRDSDVAAIRQRLLHPDVRLLTLIGAPGIGKTQLAFHVAAAVLDEFADGVFSILLASVTDPDLVPAIIASTLSLPDSGPHTPLERLKNFCRDKHILLVLDNVEQILAIAPHLADLLASCPLLKLLVTSRAPLKVRPERQVPVAPLALPDLAHLPDLAALSHYAAVALFIERAQAVQPTFTLTVDNARTIATICTRLDGLPLAIELISAWVKVLSPTTLLERLRGPLLLHSDGMHDLEPRHRTLNAAIDWSIQLLSTDEQILFQRLGIFVGGWTLEAAESICAANLPFTMLDGLATLLNKNLVKTENHADGETRFMLLETLREYALDRLAASGELPLLKRQHAYYFADFAERPLPDYTLPRIRRLWDQFELEHDNFRAALAWSRTEDSSELEARLMLALGYFWRARGHIREGTQWAADANLRTAREIASGAPSEKLLRLRAWVLDWHTIFSQFQGNITATMHEESLRIFESLGDKAGMAEILGDLGMQKLMTGDYQQGQAYLEQSLAMYRELNSPGNIANAYYFLGMAAELQNQIEQADEFFKQALALYEAVGSYIGQADTRTRLARMAIEQGEYDQAHDNLVASLTSYQDADERWQSFTVLQGFACLYTRRINPDLHRAARIFGAIEHLREVYSLAVLPFEQRSYDQGVASLRAQLDPAALAAAWAEGRAMTFDQVAAYALVP